MHFSLFNLHTLDVLSVIHRLVLVTMLHSYTSAKDLRYLSQRFAKAETHDNIITIAFGSSDPDWVNLHRTFFPADYIHLRAYVYLF